MILKFECDVLPLSFIVSGGPLLLMLYLMGGDCTWCEQGGGKCRRELLLLFCAHIQVQH